MPSRRAFKRTGVARGDPVTGVACGAGPAAAALVMHGTPEARAPPARFPAIDFHADSLMWSRWVGYDLPVRHEPPLPRAALGGHVDVPRMIDGGMGAQFFGLVSVPMREKSRGLAQTTHEQID